jgi:hypothetical protein
MSNISFTILAAVASLHTATPAATAGEAQLVSISWTDPDSSGNEDFVTNWHGVAASPDRRVFEVTNRRSEVGARNAAKSACELASGSTCKAIAVPIAWDVVVMSCKHIGRPPVSVVGASGRGLAIDVTLAKAYDVGFRPSSCVQVYSYVAGLGA